MTGRTLWCEFDGFNWQDINLCRDACHGRGGALALAALYAAGFTGSLRFRNISYLTRLRRVHADNFRRFDPATHVPKTIPESVQYMDCFAFGSFLQLIRVHRHSANS